MALWAIASSFWALGAALSAAQQTRNEAAVANQVSQNILSLLPLYNCTRTRGAELNSFLLRSRRISNVAFSERPGGQAEPVHVAQPGRALPRQAGLLPQQPLQRPAAAAGPGGRLQGRHGFRHAAPVAPGPGLCLAPAGRALLQLASRGPDAPPEPVARRLLRRASLEPLGPGLAGAPGPDAATHRGRARRRGSGGAARPGGRGAGRIRARGGRARALRGGARRGAERRRARGRHPRRARVAAARVGRRHGRHARRPPPGPARPRALRAPLRTPGAVLPRESSFVFFALDRSPRRPPCGGSTAATTSSAATGARRRSPRPSTASTDGGTRATRCASPSSTCPSPSPSCTTTWRPSGSSSASAPRRRPPPGRPRAPSSTRSEESR